MNRADVITEMKRRHGAVKQDATAWIERARTDPDGLGRHKNQLAKIAIAIEAIARTREELLGKLDDAAGDAAFANTYITLLEEIVGEGELWRIYQAGIEQHAVSPFREFVEEATWTAADILDAVLEAAKRKHERAPALVYLDPSLTPTAAGQFSTAAETPFVVRRYRQMRLPVPLVLVPSDQATSMWSLALLPHEVGHNLSQDLGRDGAGGARQTLTRDFQVVLATKGLPPERSRRWHRWADELVPDLFGVSTGGAGFASALSRVLFPLAAAGRFATLDGNTEGESLAKHPPPCLRQLVLVALLRNEGSPRSMKLADDLDSEWAAFAQPAYVVDFASDVPAIAETLWNLPVAPNSGTLLRSLGAFVPDHRFDALVAYLAGTAANRPSASHPDPFPRRYVPLAAELARRHVAKPNLERIHDEALKFSRAIEKNTFLSGAEDRLKELAGALRFSGMEVS